MTSHSFQTMAVLLARILSHICGILVAIILMAMMFLTFFDVTGRGVFNMPFVGSFELTEFMLAMLIFLGLPLVTLDDEHLEVDLLDSLIPRPLKRIQKFSIRVISFIAFSVLAWMFFRFTIRTYEYQDTTSVLEIPFFLLTSVMTVSSALAALAVVLAYFKTTGSESE